MPGLCQIRPSVARPIQGAIEHHDPGLILVILTNPKDVNHRSIALSCSSFDLKIKCSFNEPSEIQWFNDMDDDIPLPLTQATSSSTKSGGSSVLSRGTLDLFVGRNGSQVAPATMIAGSRRSGRALKPSAKVRDATDTTRPVKPSVPAKRSSDAAMAHPARKHGRSMAMDEDDLDLDSDHGEKAVHGPDGHGALDVEDEDEDDEDTAAAAEEAYQKTKAFGDADREIRMSLKKNERTADLRTVFTEEKGHVNMHTGETEDGWWCNICRDAGLPVQQCFFKGSISTRRTHIARNPKCHFPIYKSRCAEQGVMMHERAIPTTVKASSGAAQQTLDCSLVPKPAQFTKTGLTGYIVELIVAEDEAFQLVDKGPFRRLLQYLRPNLSDQDIPHRTKIREEILVRARLAVQRVKEKLEHIDSKISMTFDSWTSLTGDPFLSVTAHYIDSPADKPHVWELKSEQLAFKPIEGNHSGANIGGILLEVIDDYGIREKGMS